MMPVANRPVLHHLLNLLRRHDVSEVGINLHAFPEMIQRYFGDGAALDMAIQWSEERELLGTAGGTKKLQDYWGGETILVTSGDGLHDVDLTALLGHHRARARSRRSTVKPVPTPPRTASSSSTATRACAGSRRSRGATRPAPISPTAAST